jgi:hypothetical protein
MSDLDRTTGTRDAIRLRRGPWVVGMLLKLANERWGIFDTQERRLSKLTFRHPSMARDKFDQLYPDPQGYVLGGPGGPVSPPPAQAKGMGV